MISKTAIIHKNVKLGENVTVEDFVIIGAPPRGCAEGDLETFIGDNSIIRSHTVIYAGNRTGVNFQTGNKANIRELNEIGDNVSIGTLSVVEHHVKIGNGVRIHSQAFVPEYTVLEDECWIGPNVVITNSKYPKSKNAKKELRSAHIKRNAKIGANVTILPGISIGEDALVGAGSVITKDVPPRSIMAGNPAREIQKIKSLGKY